MAPAAASAAPADLDPGFGSGGRILRDLPGVSDERLLGAAGDCCDPGIVTVGLDAASGPGVARFTPSGELDPGFGAGGFSFTSVPECSTTLFGTGFAVAPDGKLVVTAGCTSAGGQRLAVLRYTDQGLLDPSFNPGGPQPGVVVLDIAGETTERATAASVDLDRSIVVGGQTTGAPGDFFVAKLTPGGALDPSFNSGGAQPGVRVTPIGGAFPGLNAVLRLEDGRLVALGTGDNVGALARYTPQGTLDPSFGAGGIATVDVPGSASEAVSSGVLDNAGVVVTGITDAGTGFLARVREDGSPDVGFAGGVATLDVPGNFGDLPLALARQADGKFLVGGGADLDPAPLPTDSRFLLARFTPGGALDPTFAPASSPPGTAQTDFPGGEGAADSGEQVTAIVVQRDGRFLALGTATPTVGSAERQLALALYQGDQANLSVTLTPRPARTRPGRTVRWTATVRNAGSEAALGVHLWGHIGRFDPILPLGTLAPGSSFVHRFTTRAYPGRETKWVEVYSSTRDPDLANDRAEADVFGDAHSAFLRARLIRRGLGAALARGRVPLRVRASEACRATLTLRLGRRVAGRAKLRYRRAGRKRKALRLRPIARRALRAGRPITLRLRLDSRDTVGNPGSTAQRLRLRR